MDPFVGEVRVVAFNFAPKGWAFCAGQLLAISQNTALFSLLGTQYGGDGKSNFALPNMQGNVAMSFGQGPGLSLRDQGEVGGSASVTLLTSEMPSHNHTLMAATDAGQSTPANNVMGQGSQIYRSASTNLTSMAPAALANAGGSLPHNNLAPFLCLNWLISLQGVFPPRS